MTAPPAPPRAGSRRGDPFAALAPLLAAARSAPLPPVLFVSGDDDWMVLEAAKRVRAAFTEAFREGEVSEPGTDVKEAIADAATVALFSTNRLVVLDGTDLFRARKVTAEELDGLLDEASEAAEEGRSLDRLARKALALATAAGIALGDDPADAARRLSGRVKRSDRAEELAALLSRAGEAGVAPEGGAERLRDYVERSVPGDNVLLVHALGPDADHEGTRLLRRRAVTADLSVPDEESRRARLATLGLDRALERGVAVDPEVFETLTYRGRLDARPFLSELDRLIDSAAGPRVTAEMAARMIVDERKEYGSDFVEAFAGRRLGDALGILERLLSGGEFTAFRTSREEGSARKGPKGDAAVFPLLGLLGGEVRRMLALKAAMAERGLAGTPRRVDYRAFGDRVLPNLKVPRVGAAPVPLDGHPFLLFRSFQSAAEWSLPELIDCLKGLEEVDRGVKSGEGSGRERLETYVLSRLAPRAAPSGSRGGSR